jgi:ribosome biogenesis protein SSF1/2
MKVEDCKRVVLLHHDKDSKRIEFRHYLIKAVPIGLSKSIKRVVNKKLENLNEFEDISDYVLRGAGASESDLEDMAHPESHVSVPQVTKRGDVKQTKSAIRLVEMGPRMELELIKIEEGLCDGTVLYHAHGAFPSTKCSKLDISSYIICSISSKVIL